MQHPISLVQSSRLVLQFVRRHAEWLLIAALVVLAVRDYALTPQTLSFEEIKANGVLRVLISDEPDSQYLFNDQRYGFEYELLQAFAQTHALELAINVVPYGELFSGLDNGLGDVAIGGIIDSEFVQRAGRPTIGWFDATPTVVYRAGTKRPESAEVLDDRVVKASSRYYQLNTLEALNLEDDYRSEYELLGAVAEGNETFALTTNYRALGAKHYLPRLNRAFLLPTKLNLVWVVPNRTDETLLEALNTFLAQEMEAGTPAELAETYLARQNRLTRYDAQAIHQKLRERLPELEFAFKRAARRGDVDWQMLAALSYQESRWSNDAVSPTGVRGIMQLTQSTAEYMGVSDRMDMEQSIEGAARYLKYLNGRLPEDIKEPERSWFAVGAYNVGLTHVKRAIRKVRQADKDATKWHEIAAILPNLYGRPFSMGGQAVDYVERIQIFTDIVRFYDLHLRESKDGQQPEPVLDFTDFYGGDLLDTPNDD